MKTLATLAGASALILSLAGCETLVRKAVETALETTISAESGEKVDIDLRNGGFNVRGEDGEATVAIGEGVSLPRNFPSEVPLPQAKLVAAMAGGGTFMLTYEGSNAAEGNRLADKLRDEGYEEVASFATEGGQSYTLKSEAWNVNIAWGGGSDGVLSYTVSPVSR